MLHGNLATYDGGRVIAAFYLSGELVNKAWAANMKDEEVVKAGVGKTCTRDGKPYVLTDEDVRGYLNDYKESAAVLGNVDGDMWV